MTFSHRQFSAGSCKITSSQSIITVHETIPEDPPEENGDRVHKRAPCLHVPTEVNLNPFTVFACGCKNELLRIHPAGFPVGRIGVKLVVENADDHGQRLLPLCRWRMEQESSKGFQFFRAPCFACRPYWLAFFTRICVHFLKELVAHTHRQIIGVCLFCGTFLAPV